MFDVLYCLFLQTTLASFILVVPSLDRIIAMCGDYYIGGRRFSSLSDLIGYYSYVSCLLKEEKLLSPVAPPEVGLYCTVLYYYMLKCNSGKF